MRKPRVIIYAIMDGAGKVRYVGQTRKMVDRLYVHAKTPNGIFSKISGAHLAEIDSAISDRSAARKESKWISFYRKQGEADYNKRAGSIVQRIPARAVKPYRGLTPEEISAVQRELGKRTSPAKAAAARINAKKALRARALKGVTYGPHDNLATLYRRGQLFRCNFTAAAGCIAWYDRTGCIGWPKFLPSRKLMMNLERTK